MYSLMYAMQLIKGVYAKIIANTLKGKETNTLDLATEVVTDIMKETLDD